MMLKRLLNKVKGLEGCVISPVRGVPSPPVGLVLPSDIHEFYSLCGGVVLFEKQAFPMRIVGPEEFEPANLAILGLGPQGDPSDQWYVIGRSGSDQFISVDLSAEKNGRCYDRFWDRHGVVGSCPIIARSFMEFFESSIGGGGKNLYWLNEGFSPCGDAYDL